MFRLKVKGLFKGYWLYEISKLLKVKGLFKGYWLYEVSKLLKYVIELSGRHQHYTLSMYVPR